MIDKNIGNRIKELRINKNWSQMEFADYLHTSQSAVQRIEAGETSIWAKYLQELLEIFDIKLDDLIHSSDNCIQINNDNTVVTSNQQINVHSVSDKLIELYEHRIQILEEKIRSLQSRLEGSANT